METRVGTRQSVSRTGLSRRASNWISRAGSRFLRRFRSHLARSLNGSRNDLKRLKIRILTPPTPLCVSTDCFVAARCKQTWRCHMNRFWTHTMRSRPLLSKCIHTHYTHTHTHTHTHTLTHTKHAHTHTRTQTMRTHVRRLTPFCHECVCVCTVVYVCACVR